MTELDGIMAKIQQQLQSFDQWTHEKKNGRENFLQAFLRGMFFFFCALTISAAISFKVVESVIAMTLIFYGFMPLAVSIVGGFGFIPGKYSIWELTLFFLGSSIFDTIALLAFVPINPIAIPFFIIGLPMICVLGLLMGCLMRRRFKRMFPFF